jgi:hypothetical protein
MMSLENLITIIFFTIVTINVLYKISKVLKVEPKVIDIEVIDNHAQWVYDSTIYHAQVINGKVDNKTIKRIEM